MKFLTTLSITLLKLIKICITFIKVDNQYKKMRLIYLVQPSVEFNKKSVEILWRFYLTGNFPWYIKSGTRFGGIEGRRVQYKKCNVSIQYKRNISKVLLIWGRSHDLTVCIILHVRVSVRIRVEVIVTLGAPPASPFA